MIEAMSEGGTKRRGTVFAPADALAPEPVIFSYLQGFPEKIEILAPGKSYQIDDVSLETPVKHRHPVETYGFIFHTPRHSFSWVVDTKYFDDLPNYYQGELVIINVVRLEPGAPIDHLSLPEAQQIIERIKPKVAILTHFGMTMWRAKPWELAQKLTEATHTRVIAARDGMRFDLAVLDSV